MLYPIELRVLIHSTKAAGGSPKLTICLRTC
jgi:hypothetical protein